MLIMVIIIISIIMMTVWRSDGARTALSEVAHCLAILLLDPHRLPL